jgi:hypothetical protein
MRCYTMCAALDGRKCCVHAFKTLILLDMFMNLSPYAVSQYSYAAALRYKLS